MAPSIQDGIDHMGSSTNATAVATSKSPPASNISLFGDLPDHKRRKFILVDDPHRGARVRVRVMLDQVEMKEIPDSYRKTNSVFPRSYFATQMQSPPSSARGSRFFDDDNDDANDVSGTRRGRTMVQVPMLDGTEVEVATPKINRLKRDKEIALNDLGYRMSWSQSRVFAGRTMFLQRALDAYRNKMRSSMIAAGQDVVSVAPHFETRVGKRKWLERNRRSKRSSSP